MRTHAEVVAAYKARHRAAGLCGKCPRPWAGPQQECDECRARKSARAKARRQALHAAREAAGLPPRRHGWCGFQARPQDICQHTPERARELIAHANEVGCRKRRMEGTKEILREVRRGLLDVRGSLTSEQIADLMPLFLRVHRLGIERERGRWHQAGYRAQRKAADAAEVA